MKHKNINSFLQGKEQFEATIETASNLNSRGMLELGSVCGGEPMKTLASYTYVPKKTLRATYLLEDRIVRGVSGLNEWRDVPSEGFNVYGFRYDPEFEDLRFRVALIHEDGKTIEPVALPHMTDDETKILGRLCLSKALSDLEHIAAKNSVTIQ